ncbi:MAG: BON domain-containing protein [Deltaproteobacteria bacterium]|nr:BON domain-containing protein [Deltaproteobacteria bacterium]
MMPIKPAFLFFTVASMISFGSAVLAQPPSTAGQQMSSGASAGQPSDSTLRSEVQSALAHDPLTSGSRIQVKTQDRMVTLSGTVASKQAAQRANQLASRVNGVKGVENYIHYSSP